MLPAGEVRIYLACGVTDILIFARFRACGSARQVLLRMSAERVHFPRPSDGNRMIAFEWQPIRYRNVISMLKNPFYAGVYAYGKSEKRTALVDGRVRKSYGHHKPLEQYQVLLKNHHEGYIEWAEFERNQALLAANAFGTVGGAKSGRGGRALLAGLLTCGRRLPVVYAGRAAGPANVRPDVIVADYNLPGGTTGLDAIREVRRAMGQQLPAVVISADGSSDQAPKATAARGRFRRTPYAARLSTGWGR